MRLIFSLFLLFHFSFAQFPSLKDAIHLSFHPDKEGLILHFSLEDEIFLYQDALKIKLNGRDLTPSLSYPEASFYKNEWVYFHALDLLIPQALLDQEQKSSLELHYQGCSQNGLCYAPQILHLDLKKENKLYTASPKIQGEEDRIQNLLEKENIFFIVLSFFFYGLLLSLTPCTLPMMPILSSIIIAKGGSKKTALLLSLSYVLSMSLAYALAGVGASFLGFSIQAFLQKPLILGGLALLFALFALLCFIDFRLPTKWQNFLHAKGSGANLASASLMGFLSALILSPCTVAPLAGALLYIASSHDPLLGGWALFVMGLGMGVPLLFLGLGLGFLKPGAWMHKIKLFFGFILLALSLWTLSRFVREDYILMAYGILGVCFVVFMGLFDRALNLWQKLKKSFLILILCYALMLFIDGISGMEEKQSGLVFKEVQKLKQLEEEIKSNDRLMLYFTASWCTFCKLLDSKTFSDPSLRSKLENYKKIKIDLSKSTDEKIQIVRAFESFAPPVLIFFEGGKMIHKIPGYIAADDLLQWL